MLDVIIIALLIAILANQLLFTVPLEAAKMAVSVLYILLNLAALTVGWLYFNEAFTLIAIGVAGACLVGIIALGIVIELEGRRMARQVEARRQDLIEREIIRDTPSQL